MPKRKRDFDKRSLGYVLGSLDNALEHALALKAQFDEVLGLDPLAEDYQEQLLNMIANSNHAKLCVILQAGMTACYQAQEIFSQFAIHAWGVVPDNVRKWTNTGQDWKEAQKQDEED